MPELRLSRPPVPLEDPPGSRSLQRWTGIRLLVLGMAAVGVLTWWALPRKTNDAVGWRDDYTLAAQLASEQGKLILLDFWANWCPPCRQMDHQVFSAPHVGHTINALFVPLRVDLSSRARPTSQLADHFRVDALPTMVVIDIAGKELGRHVGAADEPELLHFLSRFTHPAQQAAGDATGIVNAP